MKRLLFRGREAILTQELFEHAPIGMAILSSKKSFLRVNSAFCRFLGYSRRELLGKTVRDITHPADRDESSEKIRQMHSSGPPISRFEKRYRHKNGQTLWGDVSVSVIYDGSGKLRYDIAQVVDITQRKRTEEALRASEERFRIALAGSPTVVFSQDRDFRYTWSYNGTPSFKPKDCVGKRDSDIFTPSDARRFMQIKRNVMKTGVGRRDEVVTHLPDGEMIHDMTTEPLRDERGRIIGVICAAVDITERKRLEEALQEANEQLDRKVKDRTLRLRQLTEELTKAEHQERRRIAHVLHEDLQQRLCALKFRAGALKQTSSNPAAISQAERLLTELDEAIDLTRTLSTDLYPPVLNHLGARESIEWLATDMTDRLGLDVRFRAGKDVRLASDEIRIFAFEAVRELLLNVVKHAKVKTAEVRLSSMRNGLVRIQVRDAGVGSDSKQNKPGNGHFGLFRIRERVESLGGRFEMVSRPNKGTCVTLILPRQ